MSLEISRSDVIGTELMDYPAEDRFIKLPVKSYLDLLNVDPIPSQISVINAINNPKYRFICGALSRRQGKTYIANIIGQLTVLIPGSSVLLMSPNYSLSQISFDLQRNLIKHFDLEVVKDNAKDRVIELSNNSTIRMGSINQVDSVVGRSYDLIIFDEAALTDGRDAFNVALRPTLDKLNSKALFISTPRGRNNWFADFFYRGFNDEFPDWLSIKATYHENPRFSEDDVKEAKKSMSTAEFAQEYLADFNTYEGQVWNFDYEKCTTNLDNFNPEGMDIFAGLDVGYKDPTAFIVIAYDWDTESYYVLDEYIEAEKTTEQHAMEIQERVMKWDIDYIYIDSAAQQTRYDFAQNYDISTINAKKSVLNGIGHVGNIVDNNKLFVNQKCTHTLECLDQYQWDPNPNLMREKPKHDKFSHMSDALRYALYSFETASTSF
jgi:hypothetical protein